MPKDDQQKIIVFLEHLWATAERLYPSPPKINWMFFPSDKFAPGVTIQCSKYFSCRNLKKHDTGRWYFPEHAKDREKPVWSVHNTWVVSQKAM